MSFNRTILIFVAICIATAVSRSQPRPDPPGRPEDIDGPRIDPMIQISPPNPKDLPPAPMMAPGGPGPGAPDASGGSNDASSGNDTDSTTSTTTMRPFDDDNYNDPNRTFVERWSVPAIIARLQDGLNYTKKSMDNFIFATINTIAGPGEGAAKFGKRSVVYLEDQIGAVLRKLFGWTGMSFRPVKFYGKKVQRCFNYTVGDVPKHVATGFLQCITTKGDELVKILNDGLQETKVTLRMARKILRGITQCSGVGCMLNTLRKTLTRSSSLLLHITETITHVGWYFTETEEEIPACFTEALTLTPAFDVLEIGVNFTSCLRTYECKTC